MIRLLLVFAENLDRRYGAQIAEARRRLALEVGRTRLATASLRSGLARIGAGAGGVRDKLRSAAPTTTWSILSLGALTRSLVTKRPRDP